MEGFDYDFDAGFDQDYSFMDNEDFGLAKSFTTAPFGLIDPSANLKAHEEPDLEHEAENISTEIKSEGFCFKMHPAEDQV